MEYYLLFLGAAIGGQWGLRENELLPVAVKYVISIYGKIVPVPEGIEELFPNDVPCIKWITVFLVCRIFIWITSFLNDFDFTSCACSS